MAWLWDSFEEFCYHVRPGLVADHDGPFREARRLTLLEQHTRITKALMMLASARDALRRLGFGDWPPQDEDHSRADQAYNICEQAVWYGEDLLLYHSRLARTRGGDTFISRKDLIELKHWDRYAASRRIFAEIHKFLEGLDGLIDGYHELATQDEEYLQIPDDLPGSVEDDFHLANDLVSVGLDDVALLVAGRGLEGTMRQIARERGLVLGEKGKQGSVAEASFYHLIEVFGKLRWRGGPQVLDKDGQALLHYLRSLRNAGAHPSPGQKRKRQSAKELAKVTVAMAGSLWQDATKEGARLLSAKVTF